MILDLPFPSSNPEPWEWGQNPRYSTRHGSNYRRVSLGSGLVPGQWQREADKLNRSELCDVPAIALEQAAGAHRLIVG